MPVRAAVTIGALGVVFGDIGTSPIYSIQTVFNPDDPHPVPVRGRILVSAGREEIEGSLRDFVEDVHGRVPPVLRVPRRHPTISGSRAIAR